MVVDPLHGPSIPFGSSVQEISAIDQTALSHPRLRRLCRDEKISNLPRPPTCMLVRPTSRPLRLAARKQASTIRLPCDFASPDGHGDRECERKAHVVTACTARVRRPRQTTNVGQCLLVTDLRPGAVGAVHCGCVNLCKVALQRARPGNLAGSCISLVFHRSLFCLKFRRREWWGKGQDPFLICLPHRIPGGAEGVLCAMMVLNVSRSRPDFSGVHRGLASAGDSLCWRAPKSQEVDRHGRREEDWR